jgi:hypothetical protein
MAQATVIALDFNAAKGAYKGVAVTVKNEKGVKEHFVFGNSPIAKEIKQLSVGDTVEVGMTQNGKFWNLGSIAKVDASTAPAPTAKGTYPSKPSYGGGSSDKYQYSEEYIKRKDLSIARQSSVKAAIELVSNMLAQGLYKKTITPDFIYQEVQRYTNSIASYVTLKTDDDILDSSMEDITPEAPYDADDDGFPG